MDFVDRIRFLPAPLRSVVYRVAAPLVRKERAELAFWRSRWRQDGGTFHNDHYQAMMLGMAGEKDGAFLRGRVVADFGCGPRGSLAWATEAAVRIGVDVLADDYMRLFAPALEGHGMVYVKASERHIPISTGVVDVMFTLNALDHVKNLDTMCNELKRVIKPGGELIGSFNLNEPTAPCEPQTLTEERLDRHLYADMEVISRRITEPDASGDRYAPFQTGELRYTPGRVATLWIRARKPKTPPS